jgi:hypothetical protein
MNWRILSRNFPFYLQDNQLAGRLHCFSAIPVMTELPPSSEFEINCTPLACLWEWPRWNLVQAAHRRKNA